MPISKPSLSFYTNIPTPYQCMFFDELSKLFDLTVIYYSISEGNREWKFEFDENYKTILLIDNLIAKIFQKVVIDFHFSWQIFSVAWKDKSNYIIVGGSYATANGTVALLFNRFKRRKVVYFSEALFKVKNPFKYSIKWLYLRILSLCCNAIFCVGKKAAQSFSDYNINLPKFVIPYNINVTKFNKLDFYKRDAYYKQYKNDDQIIVLYSGVLEFRKGVDILIKAVKKIKNKNLRLLILGDGSQRKELMSLSENDNRIIYAGFREPDELPYFFAIADVFALASRYDGWAVVINEAIAVNLPIICSDKVGAGIELITSPELGLLCQSENVSEFKSSIELLITDDNKRNTIKENSKKLIPFICSKHNATLVYDIFVHQLV